VKIVIINIDNKIILTFDNVPADVDKNRDKIVEVFDAAFKGWKFNIDKTEEATTAKAEMPKTKVYCHFLNDITFEPVLNKLVEA
jgi:hypothetical protein